VAAPARGAVVLVPFPFSDLSQSKLRPAVVLAAVGRGEYLLCQVTSNPYGDPAAVELAATAFASGSLNTTSYARPGKLFTASERLIQREVAILTLSGLTRIVDATIRLLHGM
jgi:mRNA interferase MazF